LVYVYTTAAAATTTLISPNLFCPRNEVYEVISDMTTTQMPKLIEIATTTLRLFGTNQWLLDVQGLSAELGTGLSPAAIILREIPI
jgi:hypothetical protein